MIDSLVKIYLLTSVITAFFDLEKALDIALVAGVVFVIDTAIRWLWTYLELPIAASTYVLMTFTYNDNQTTDRLTYVGVWWKFSLLILFDGMYTQFHLKTIENMKKHELRIHIS